MYHCINFFYKDIDDPFERAYDIKNAGFSHTFLWRYRTSDGMERLISHAEAARKVGLTVETVHAEYAGINDMWRCEKKRKDTFEFLKRCIADTASIGVKTMVIHVSSGDFPPPKNRRGLEAFVKLCEFASENGVELAFENLRKKRYLAYILDNIALDSVKFCFDCGHENLYDGGNGILEEYKDRLVCVHLHDNFGKRDDHMIPFDASIDFDRIASRLAGAPETPVTLEIDFSECGETDEKAFLQRAFAAAHRIGAAIEKHRRDELR